jgi:hypothetical protein
VLDDAARSGWEAHSILSTRKIIHNGNTASETGWSWYVACHVGSSGADDVRFE